MATLSSPARPHAGHAPPVGVTLAAIGLIVALLGLGAAYAAGALLDRRPSASGEAGSRQVVLVGHRLTLPADWLRQDEQPASGFARQIRIAIAVPLGRNGALAPMEMTLLPLSQVRSSASLLDGVYLHQFMSNEVSGPPGLVGKPLYGSDGYEDETVWYDALSPNPFVAKCAAAPVAGLPGQCLRTVALPGGIAAVYSFDSTVLASWKSFDAVMLPILSRIGALAGPGK